MAKRLISSECCLGWEWAPVGVMIVEEEGAVLGVNVVRPIVTNADFLA